MQMELVDLDALRTGQKNDSVYPNAAARVIEWRRKHGKMSQIRFAQKAGISVGCLQALEGVQRDTRRPQMDKVAKAMGLTYAELTAGDAEPVKATDTRFKDLLPDDLEVAHMYQRADGTLKVAVRRMLVEYYRRANEALKDPLRLPLDANFHEQRHGDRRVVDRRATAAQREQATVLNERVTALLQRLLRLAPDALDDLEALADEGSSVDQSPLPAEKKVETTKRDQPKARKRR